MKIDLEAQLNAIIDEAVASNEGWFNLLKKISECHQFSFKNLLLAYEQLGKAPISLAGYKQWLAKGIQVQKGEKAIYVYAPKFAKDKETGDQKVTGFIPVPVFDISQTDAEVHQPNPIQRLESDQASELIPRLVEFATKLRFSVDLENETLEDSVNGTTDFRKRSIVVKNGLSPFHRTKTLIHEISHALLHEGVEPSRRAICEVEAESSAYIVLSRLGYDSSAYSGVYVATWSGGDRSNVLQALKGIEKASKAILEALEA